MVSTPASSCDWGFVSMARADKSLCKVDTKQKWNQRCKSLPSLCPCPVFLLRTTPAYTTHPSRQSLPLTSIEHYGCYTT